MKHSTLIYSVLAAVAMVTGLAGCDVHEVPQGEETVAVTLYLNFDESLPLFREVDYVTRSVPGYKLQHTVQLYPSLGATDKWADIPAFTTVFVSDDLSQQTVQMQLDPLLYKVLVWTEYVDADGKPIHYNNDDFKSIVTTQPEKGCTDLKDAFRGELDMNLSVVTQTDAKFVASVDMERPLAKYNIVATDKEEFLQMYIRRLQDRWARENVGQSFDVKATDIDLSVFRVEFVYTGYLPDTFNNWSNRPVDSRTGVSFQSSLRELDGNNLEIGFDYMLIGEGDGSVSLQVRVYDDRNDIISISNMDVPMQRSMLTTMKGKFLTSGAASGISIDPGFDGNFNIQI